MGVYITVGGFILFDILTGVLKALKCEGLNSTCLREGLFHKLSEVIVIAFSAMFEFGIDYIDIGINIPLLEIVAVYICTMEFVSIIENISIMNPKLSALFRPYLEKLKSDKEDE